MNPGFQLFGHPTSSIGNPNYRTYPNYRTGDYSFATLRTSLQSYNLDSSIIRIYLMGQVKGQRGQDLTDQYTEPSRTSHSSIIQIY